jgi:acyl-CoA thioesterase-1
MSMRSLLFLLALLSFQQPAKADVPLRVVALGDSLTAGYGLQAGEDFATKLQEALIADGVNVKIDNAGVSGDTSAGGKSRLEWAVAGDVKPRLVIVALGANDMLRGLDPAVTKENLGAILTELKKQKIPALLVGMKSPTNLGPLFQGKFDKIYPALAKEYNVPLYPFFLDGVAMKSELNLDDGIHPNTKGIEVIVKNILPAVKKALKD